MGGFTFEKIEVQLPDACVKNLDFESKLLILLSQRIERSTQTEKYISKCKEFLGDDFLFQLNVKDDYFKKSNLFKEKIAEFSSYPNLKNRQTELANFFIQVINADKDDVKKRIEILKNIQDKPPGLFKYLLELSVAIDTNNQAWAKKMVKKIINMEPQELLFKRALESVELQLKVRDGIKQFLKKFNANFRDKMLNEMLNNQMENLFPFEKFKDDLPFWSFEWSLSEKRNFLNSRNYGSPFIGFWFLELISATHEAEVMQFLKEVLDKENVKKYGRSFPWIFTFYPINDFQNDVVLIFRDLWQSEESYKQYLVLELLENPKFKELISKEIPELGRPIFQLQRTLFLNMLRKGENLNFSIYQLLKLGDRSEELLWWVAFFEK